MDGDTTRFGDVLAIPLRNGLTRPKRVRGDGTLMVNMGELFAHDRIGNLLMDRVPLADRNPERDLLEPDDLLFARQSLVAAGAGKIAIFTGAEEPVTFESHLIRARPDPQLVSPSYLFFFFQSPRGKSLMGSIVNQVSAAGIRGSDLVKLRLPLPPLEEQYAVASVLESLDDKIESNRQMASALAEVPLGLAWEASRSAASAVPLGELSEQVRMPGDPTQPYIGLDAMPKGSTILSDWNDHLGATGASWAFERGDVLFGKLRPYFRKVAVAPISGRCSREILVLRPSQPEYYGILVATIASKPFIDYCTAMSTGTKMPRAEWKVASNFDVGLPDGEVLSELAELTRRNYARATSSIRESHTLTAIRNTLLPRLVSGKIRVPLSDDPEDQVGAALKGLGA